MRYRRIARRRGAKRAVVAVGRSVLTIIWHLLSHPHTHFNDLGADFYNSRTDTSHKKRRHMRELEALGFRVILEPVTQPTAASLRHTLDLSRLRRDAAARPLTHDFGLESQAEPSSGTHIPDRWIVHDRLSVTLTGSVAVMDAVGLTGPAARVQATRKAARPTRHQVNTSFLDRRKARGPGRFAPASCLVLPISRRAFRDPRVSARAAVHGGREGPACPQP